MNLYGNFRARHRLDIRTVRAKIRYAAYSGCTSYLFVYVRYLKNESILFRLQLLVATSFCRA